MKINPTKPRLTQNGADGNAHSVHGALVPRAEAIQDEPGAPELVEVDLLQDAVVADGQQHVLLQLVILRERLHGVEINLDDLAEDSGMKPLADVSLGQVEEAGRRGHLDVEDGLVAAGRTKNKLK